MESHHNTTENLGGGCSSSTSGMQNSCDSSANMYGNSTDKNTDPYGLESNGTVKFIGGTGVGLQGVGNLINNNGGLGMGDIKFDYLTSKINPVALQKLRSEQLNKTELLNMLSRLEGELQARDVVIATLRNERVKQLIHNLRNQPKIPLNDPHAALFRDKVASTGNLVSRQSSVTVVQAEMEVRAIIEQQMESLYQMVTKQRSTQSRMVNILKESLENNQRMRQELEEEKRKHEHDTAQGDDITYGLEIERTKLKQELESERTQRKKLEKDIKKLQEQFDFERGRQKQIVLLLLAERKKIIMKYIEERKRSEDLAQILSEEKQQKDSMADGLEEETKKSLRMEAELEKQTLQFDQERKAMTINLAKEEKRIKELEAELAQMKIIQVPVVGQVISSKVRNIPIPNESIRPPSSVIDVAKIVQPTATVSSVPVSGPTTGIARSVNSTAIGGFNSPAAKMAPRKQSAGVPLQQQQSLPLHQHQQSQQPLIHNQTGISSNSIGTTTVTSEQISQNLITGIAEPLTSATNVATAAVTGGSTTLNLTTGNIQTPNNTTISNPTTTGICGIIGGNNSTNSCNNSGIGNYQQQHQESNITLTGGGSGIITIPTTSNITGTNSGNCGVGGSGGSGGGGNVRGVPPPIPPNKPVVPPKREPSISRLGSSISTNNIK